MSKWSKRNINLHLRDPTMKFPPPFSSLFVSPIELHRALSNASSNLRIVPVAAGKASSLPSFESQHVPGSVFFNMDLARDANSEYPMMLPTSTQFSAYMTELGIHTSDVLVIYDAFETGLHSSPRVAWICQYFGHQAVHVLNNFPRYVYEALPVCHGRLPSLSLTPYSGPQPGYPVQQPLDSKVISFEELRDMIVNTSSERRFQIIDARPSDRFLGADGDAVASVLSGHMPSAINVPLSTILGPDKALLSPVDLKALFAKAGVMENMPTVLSCNSGVTAAALDLALRASGFQMETRLYDGSWSEWAKRAHEGGLIIKK